MGPRARWPSCSAGDRNCARHLVFADLGIAVGLISSSALAGDEDGRDGAEGRGRASMSGTLIQVAVLVALTHGVRALGRLFGPRRCGLVLGLPSATAVMLVFCGRERGMAEAAEAAEVCLLGMIATAALPLIYARAIGVGRGPSRAPLAAVGGYVAMAAALRALPPVGAEGCVAASALGVLAACRLAGRMSVAGGAPRWVATSRGRALALRTAIPATLVATIRAIGAVAGAGWARLFITFPGMSLAVLVATHLEAGPAAAGRLARAMPAGNLGMVAFLAAFRFAGPALGLGAGTALGLAAALATLLAIERLARTAAVATSRYPGPIRARRRIAVRFSPRVEPIFG
jgi:hypothetical protein